MTRVVNLFKVYSQSAPDAVQDVKIFEVKSTRTASKRKPNEEPLFIYAKNLAGWWWAMRMASSYFLPHSNVHPDVRSLETSS